ncbi:Mur ligase middle domain protein [[Eubacterium] yurii subsp. margaretiae ATCC 43715]|nr:Mur ligase middle domain protein [[Eubacterium] yurii subsp. margaretiae ATCC 43715]
MHYLALITGKLILVLLKIIGRNGGSLPGKIAVKICPILLKYFKYPQKTILVTGTNGKTSTANLIYQSFEKAGHKSVSNSRGDNIINGIVSLLIKNSSLGFKINAEVLVLEVDELTLAKNLPYINASDIVITNFFRDQLDRVGEMETIILKIQNSLLDYHGRLYLNEDDPNVNRFSHFVKDAEIITFGVEKVPHSKEQSEDAKEGRFCPVCGNELIHDYYQYSHIGKYHCISCDFSSDLPDFTAENINYAQKSFDLISKSNKICTLHYNLSATYHIYNLVAASCVCITNKVDEKAIDDVFSHFYLGIGRMETIEVKNKKILLNLVKNPAGANEILKYIGDEEGNKSLIFLLNDNFADGKDISWIWDVNFEYMGKLDNVILTGTRAYEIATRVKFARICENITVEKNIDKCIDTLLNFDTKLYVISTYTGLFDIRKKIVEKGK